MKIHCEFDKDNDNPKEKFLLFNHFIPSKPLNAGANLD